MSVTPGTRLGPYEIIATIGAGGMGEVYRAKDSRLGRDVAIKVLPPSFVGDGDRRVRFEREAQAVAALSHPNILAIHDIGTHDSQLFVVNELLEGETLRDRLRSGAQPVRKALEIAVQIARGLGAAHGKGIVHRDLKPENIFLLDDGQVKILDFGLARQVASGDHAGATRTMAATDPGTVLGTVGYMAPEQVRGQNVDTRADLFAFGAVLYEMVSGRRAFQRDTAADTMTAILTQDPPELIDSRPDLSPGLNRIIHHCLEKTPAERFQTARDIVFALEAFSGSMTAGTAVANARLRPSAWRWAAMAAMAAAVAIAGVVVGYRLVPPPPPITFSTKTFDTEWITNARFAPDDKTIVFSAALIGSTPSVFIIRPNSVAAQAVGPPHTHLLSISSQNELAVLVDAHHLAQRVFTGTLARMTLDGATRALQDDVRDADWSPDGSQLAMIRNAGGQDRLEYPTGHVLYQSSAGYLSDVRVSPDGTRVAFFDHPILFDDRGWVKVVDVSGRVTTLTPENGAEQGLAWSRDGRSVLFSPGYRPSIVDISGKTPARVAFPAAGRENVYDVAADGRVLVARDDGRSSLRARLPGESAEREFAWLDSGFNGSLSRDGRLLAFEDDRHGSDYKVYLRKTDGSLPVELGRGQVWDMSPDGGWVLARIPSTDHLVLYPTGAGDTVPFERGPIKHYRSGRWFPDGRRILLCGDEASRPPRCYEQSRTGGPPSPITPDNVVGALIAPNGRTLLLETSSNEKQVYSIGGVAKPAPGITSLDVPLGWSRDGGSVFVQTGVDGPARIERVDVTTGTRIRVQELAPPDRAGLTDVTVTHWIGDGEGYVYEYYREASKLIAVGGVK